MASDAYVKEIENLYSMRSDLLSVAGSLRNSLSMISQYVNVEESEMMGLLNQVELRFAESREALYEAERAYDEYRNYTDPENYSAYTESELREAVDAARSRYQRAEQNLDQAKSLVNQARQVLYGMHGTAQSAASLYDSQASHIAHAVEKAAHEIGEYNNVGGAFIIGPNDNCIFLPLAGCKRAGTGNVEIGYTCCLYTSTKAFIGCPYFFAIDAYNNMISIDAHYGYVGMSVRPVKDKEE